MMFNFSLLLQGKVQLAFGRVCFAQALRPRPTTPARAERVAAGEEAVAEPSASRRLAVPRPMPLQRRRKVMQSSFVRSKLPRGSCWKASRLWSMCRPMPACLQ